MNQYLLKTRVAIGSSLRWGDVVFEGRAELAKGGWVYIMASAPHGTLYIGVTSNLARRVWEHKNDLGSEHCRKHGCKTLVYVERIEDITEAIAREKAMKAWNRRWKTEMISRANPDWRDLYDDINK